MTRDVSLIDSGACHSIISQRMVSKSHLKKIATSHLSHTLISGVDFVIETKAVEITMKLVFFMVTCNPSNQLDTRGDNIIK